MTKVRLITAALIVATVVFTVTSGSASSAGPVPASGAGSTPHLRRAATSVEGVPPAGHVFVIVGENTSLRQLKRARAPFIAGRLKRHSAWLTGYRAVPNSSSTGDYIEMTSGQNVACERADDNPVNVNTDKAVCHQGVDNIFNQLENANISWADWQESMPHPCAFYDDGTNWSGDTYGAHHNPAIYYDNIEGASYVEDFGSPPSPVCLQHDLPMGTTGPDDTRYFDHALKNGSIPRFNYIVPNDCENGHDVCGGTRDSVRQFDAFVKREVAHIRRSPAWDPSSLIVVTWDEQGDATPRNRQVGSIWHGGQVSPGVAHGRWTHASLLRTLEDAFGLPRLADAQHDQVIGTIWR